MAHSSSRSYAARLVLRPDRTGEFEMGCEIEGHRQAGMIGKVLVK